MRRSMITSMDTVTQVSIKFRENKKSKPKHEYKKHITQTIYMKMAINVNKYGTGGRCVYMFRYTHTGIRKINMQIEKEERYIRRVVRITKAPCQKYVVNSQEKKKENKKVVINTKPITDHAALATQLERQVEKKTYTYDTDS